MITTDIQVTIGYGDKLKEMAKTLGVDVHWLCADQMRLWCQDLLKITFPHSAQSGKQAIENDMNKIFAPVDDAAVLQKWQQEAGAGDVYTTSKRGRMKVNRDLLTTPMATWHINHTKKANHRTWMQKDRGYAWGGRMPVPAKELSRYTGQIQAHVGTLKAGWIDPLMHWQAVSGGGANIPSWVMANKSRASGVATDSMGKDGNGEISSANTVGWAGSKIDKGLMQAAQRTRQKDLDGKILKRADRIVAQFNESKASTGLQAA